MATISTYNSVNVGLNLLGYNDDPSWAMTRDGVAGMRENVTSGIDAYWKDKGFNKPDVPETKMVDYAYNRIREDVLGNPELREKMRETIEGVNNGTITDPQQIRVAQGILQLDDPALKLNNARPVVDDKMKAAMDQYLSKDNWVMNNLRERDAKNENTNDRSSVAAKLDGGSGNGQIAPHLNSAANIKQDGPNVTPQGPEVAPQEPVQPLPSTFQPPSGPS